MKNKLKLMLCSVLVVVSPLVSAMDKVTLQLQWKHSFQFAGYYMAKEKGYFSEAGLDVTFKEAGDGINPVNEVVSGKAQYGIGTSSIMVDKAKGSPVVVLGVIFQNSPQMLIGRAKTGESQYRHKLSDYKNEKFWLEPNTEELTALLKQEQFDLSNIMNAEGNALNKFLKKEANVIIGYSIYEPYFLQKEHIPYKIFHPRNYGLDFYGDNLFTTEYELKNHQNRSLAFLDAIKKGWSYALKNKEETIKLISEKYAPNLEEEFLYFESSEIDVLMKDNLVPIGFMNKERWDNIANIYKKYNLIPEDFSTDKFFYITNENSETIKELRIYLIIVSILLFLAIFNIGYVKKLNQRLRTTNDKLEEANKKLNYVASHDVLTGLPNRVMFFEHVKKGIALAKRNSTKVALMFIDLDKFKPINDTYGHYVGDILLKEVGKRLTTSIRETDTAGRIGGDEFVIFLTNLNDSESAINVAKKINEKIHEPFIVNGKDMFISVSIGIAIYPDHTLSEENLTKYSDAAMYKAKYGGKEKIVMYQDGMTLDL
jgi:diguanylate cyclase (GGDEF)-like protein